MPYPSSNDNRKVEASRYVRKRKTAKQEAEEFRTELVIKTFKESESSSTVQESSNTPCEKTFDEVHIVKDM